MAQFLTLLCLIIFSLLHVITSSRIPPNGSRPRVSDPSSTSLFKYHRGPLLYGHIKVNLIWYGKFTPTQRAIVSDFITSLSSPPPKATKTQTHLPSVATWWSSIGQYYHLANRNPTPLSLTLGQHTTDTTYTFGKSLTDTHLAELASRGTHRNSINVVLTSSDVSVVGFCSSRCGTHSSTKTHKHKFPYIWVGNSEVACPGQCAWPFHQPIYGPQGPPLVAPNNDVGMDGMVINLASLLAGTVTNPYGGGFFQGPEGAPLEAGSACSGVYGKGAYPGYAGEVLVDESSGGSYNAVGGNGRKYLLPALYDPSKFTCSTLV